MIAIDTNLLIYANRAAKYSTSRLSSALSTGELPNFGCTTLDSSRFRDCGCVIRCCIRGHERLRSARRSLVIRIRLDPQV